MSFLWHLERTVKASPHRTHGHDEVQESSKRGHVLAQYRNSQREDIVSNCAARTPCSCLRMNSIRLWLTTTADILSCKECLPQLSQLSSASFVGHGIPEKLVSDNGPQFSAQEFAHFANYWDFRRITSSLTYPQLNGLAEKSVHIAKQLLKKSKSDNPDPYT